MQRFAVLSCSLVVLQGLSACGGDFKKRYRLEHQRLLHAERHISRTAGVIKGLQRTLKQHLRRNPQLENELRVMRVRLGRTQQRLRQCRLQKKLTIALRKTPLGDPHVALAAVRIWNPANRRRRTAATVKLRRLLPRWKKCYRTFGGGHPKELPLRGSFWLVYGVRRKRVVRPRILSSSLRRPRNRSYADRRQNQRAARLEKCFLGAIRKLRPRAGVKLVRIAAQIVVADSAAQARTVAKLRFKWPWKQVKRRRSGVRQVCRVGRRGGRFSVLTPSRARPCKSGLKCCYPCGIRGCDWICLRRCPPPMP